MFGNGGSWRTSQRCVVLPLCPRNNELLATAFVDEAAPDTQKYFKQRMPGWQVETLQEILSVVVFAFKKHRTELAKEKKQDKQQEASLPVGVLAQNLQ